MQPRTFRLLSAAALALLTAFAVAQAQPPVSPSQTGKGDKKGPGTKEPEVKWPTQIGGKDIHAVLRDLDSNDPILRETAARTLPMFGPPAQRKEVSRALMRHMTGNGERDPGVRVVVFQAVGAIKFDDEADNKEALRLLAEYVDNPAGPSAALYRLRAIQALTMFGPKAEAAIKNLTGQAIRDPSYETRRTIAASLAQIGFDPVTGPNMRALTVLADRLASDPCAAVRLEALQSLLLMGPPWLANRKPDDKMPPPIDMKSVAVIVKYMRARIGNPNAKPKPILPTEKDPQVEILARLVLMRFDPIEINDENLDALARYLTGKDMATKVQAITAFTYVGELASKKVQDVVRVMEDKESPFQLVMATIQALAAMGDGAKPALPNLKKMLMEKKKPLAEKTAEIEKLQAAKKTVEPKLAGEKIALDGQVKLLEAAIKHIEESKPRSPAGTVASPDPKTDPKTPPKKR